MKTPRLKVFHLFHNSYNQGFGSGVWPFSDPVFGPFLIRFLANFFFIVFFANFGSRLISDTGLSCSKV